jgi:tyrosine-protein phosphatase SIW14
MQLCATSFLLPIDMRLFSFARKCSLTFTLLLVFSMCSCCATVSTQSIAGPCSNNLGSAIQNFCVVTPNVLWRGARPDKDGAAWLIQQGVRTIVNLELILDDKPVFGHVIVADANNYEVGYFRIHDWEPLTILAPSIVDDHGAHFLAIVSQQPKPVYVHCRCGTKRTAVMVAAYRVLIEGVSDEEAIDEMRRYPGPWFKADAKYIRALSKRREEIRHKVMEWIPKVKKDAQVVCANGICAVSDH